MFLLYLNAVSVTNNKGGGVASHGLHMEFSTKVRALSVDYHTTDTPLPHRTTMPFRRFILIRMCSSWLWGRL